MGNFTSLTREERENNLAMMKMILDLAVDLEASTVKVLAEWIGTTLDSSGVATYEIASAHNGTRLDLTTLGRWRVARDGFMCVEECAPVVKNHDYEGIDEVDRIVTNAVRYIDNLLNR
jgi:hypothetical protein